MSTDLLSLVETDTQGVTGFRTIPVAYEATGSLHRRAQLPEALLAQCYVLIVTHQPSAYPSHATSLTLESLARARAVTIDEPIMCAVLRYVKEQHLLFPSVQPASVQRPDSTEPGAPSERLGYIREHLSLNVSHLSTVFDVERKTIYQWLTGEVAPRTAHQLRIKKLFDVAKRWAQLSPATPVGDLLRTPFRDDTSLLDLLRAAETNLPLLTEVLNDLHQVVERTKSEFPSEGKSVEEIARERGVVLPSSEAMDDRIQHAILSTRTGRS